MDFIKRAFCAFTIASVVITGFAPPSIGNTLQAQEAFVVEGGNSTGLPREIQPGIAYLLDYLNASGADAETISAARDFLDFVQNNEGIVSRDVAELSEAEFDAYRIGLSRGAKALKSLAFISERLANGEWLRAVDPDLAEQILRECGRTVVSGRDMYAAAEQILRNPSEFDGEPQNLLDDLTLAQTECIENLRAYSILAAQQMQELEQFIAKKEVELKAAIERGDQEAIDRIEAEIKAAEDRKRKVEDSNKLAGLLKLLIGIAGVVYGVAGIVASSGSCLPCYGEVIAGVATAAEGMNEIEGDDIWVPDQVAARRPGIDPTAQPTKEEREAERERIEQDLNFSYVPPEIPGGNYLVAKDDQTGDIVIFQIVPPKRITIEIAEARLSPLGATDSVSKENMGEVAWIKVADPLSVTPTSVRVILEGILDGNPIFASFEQQPVDKPFVITVEAR